MNRYLPHQLEEPPLNDQELKEYRQMSAYFQSGRTVVRVLAWVCVALGGFVAILGGILNIVHQSGSPH